jgi:hypothetical protein
MATTNIWYFPSKDEGYFDRAGYVNGHQYTCPAGAVAVGIALVKSDNRIDLSVQYAPISLINPGGNTFPFTTSPTPIPAVWSNYYFERPEYVDLSQVIVPEGSVVTGAQLMQQPGGNRLQIILQYATFNQSTGTLGGTSSWTSPLWGDVNDWDGPNVDMRQVVPAPLSVIYGMQLFVQATRLSIQINIPSGS